MRCCLCSSELSVAVTGFQATELNEQIPGGLESYIKVRIPVGLRFTTRLRLLLSDTSANARKQTEVQIELGNYPCGFPSPTVVKPLFRKVSGSHVLDSRCEKVSLRRC